MTLKLWKRKRKSNNKGAALVSVLVITAFISILATTLLYIAATNYRQKLTNYQNKSSFYTAEKALDELKSAMVSDVQDAYYKAYRKVSSQLLFLENEDERQKKFQDFFMDELKKTWDNRTGATTLEKVKTLMTEKGYPTADIESIYGVAGYGTYKLDGTDSDVGKVAKRFALRGVQAYTPNNSYTTFIYTDICVEAPDIRYWVEKPGASSSGEEESAVVESSEDIISFTDCISYANWQKSDYEYGESHYKGKSDHEYVPVEESSSVESSMP